MNPIRVLVANRPRLIRELVTATISDQPDIEVVGEIREDDDLQSAVERMHPEVLIVALDRSNQLPEKCEAILRNYPYLRVIAIASDRNSSIFYRTSLQIESSQIEASEAGVLGAIRGKMQPAGGTQESR
jgi:chemotaxis response regulator CheB